MNDFSGGVSTGPAGAKVSHRLYTLSENIHCSQEEAAMTILDRIAQTVREVLKSANAAYLSHACKNALITTVPRYRWPEHCARTS